MAHQNKRYQKAALGALAILVLYAGYTVWGMLFGGAGTGQGGPMGPGVEALRLTQTPVAQTYEIPGRTRAHKVAHIRPQVSGIITQRLFEEGAYVEKGQQLYQIDATSYNALYQSARADYKKAQAQSQRLEELLKIDAVSRQEYDAAVAARAQAKAQMDVTKVDLDYTKVYAPISGYIGKSHVTSGALVTKNQEQVLATITQLTPLYVDLTLPAQRALHLRQAMANGVSATVHVLDANGQKLSDEAGALQFSEVVVDEGTGTVLMRALMPNTQGVILPGMYVRTQVSLPEEAKVLVPHAAAIRTPQGGLNVWVVSGESTVNPMPIQVQGSYNNQWIVTEGVAEGAVIVTKGFQKIAPGTPVQVTMQAKTSAPEEPTTQEDAPVDVETPVEENAVPEAVSSTVPQTVSEGE